MPIFRLPKLTRPARQLIWELARHELRERYLAKTLGPFWLVAHPLVLVTTYLLVFGYVMRLEVGEPGKGPYSLYFLTAFAPWMALSDILGRSPTVIQQNAALVKQIVFPVVILPAKTSLAVMLAQLPLFAIVIGYALVWDPGAWRMLPLVIVLLGLLLVLMCGIAFVLSSLGVFVRDLQDFVTLSLTVGIFLTPVLYPPAMLQGWLGTLVALNPLSAPLYCFRDVLFSGRIEHPLAWVAFAVLAVVTAIVGHRLFKRLAPAFGDAL